MHILNEALKHSLAKKPTTGLYRQEKLGIRDISVNNLFEAPSPQAIQRISGIQKATYLPFPIEEYGETMDPNDFWDQVVIPNIKNRIAADAEKYGWKKIGIRVEAVSVGRTLQIGETTIRSVRGAVWNGIATQYSSAITGKEPRTKMVFCPDNPEMPITDPALADWASRHARDMRNKLGFIDPDHAQDVFPVVTVYNLGSQRVIEIEKIDNHIYDNETWHRISILEPPNGIAGILRRGDPPIHMMYVLPYPK